jgi:hypothetical protein
MSNYSLYNWLFALGTALAIIAAYSFVLGMVERRSKRKSDRINKAMRAHAMPIPPQLERRFMAAKLRTEVESARVSAHCEWNPLTESTVSAAIHDALLNDDRSPVSKRFHEKEPNK